ncbi:MAG: hypothetical protein IJJ26_01305 [Victivallales bacterium]|nr:hypothetical protein [Victivallales bacterium]
MLSLNPLACVQVRRLSGATHDLAKKYLTGVFRPELREPEFSVEELCLPPEMPQILRHAKMARLIAEKAPLTIRPEERLVGSAPLLPAVRHLVPGFGNTRSISHTTADFGDAIRLGLSGLEAELTAKKAHSPEAGVFCDALLEVIAAMRHWVSRYREACLARQEDSLHLKRLVSILERVPENPPASFHEALQSFWMFFEFQRLCGNWSGLGRFDEILGPYLQHDLDAGTISLDEARELVAHFWLKGTEWCFGLRQGNPWTPDSGDAQHYQNVILGGVGRDGQNIENAVTHLVLDVIEELHISDYPVAVRLNRHTSERLLQRIADVQVLGGGIVSVYQEETVMDALRKYGYPESDLPTFTNDGCWEVIFPGRTRFGYNPFDALLLFQNALFAHPDAASIEELFGFYHEAVHTKILELKERIAKHWSPGHFPDDAVLSLVMPSCRRNGRSYTNYGTDYTIRAIHAGGLPDVANSLRAIQKAVFEEHWLSLPELVQILQKDWEGQEPLRQKIASSILYYGNDEEHADQMLQKVLDDFTGLVDSTPPLPNILTPAGVSTFGREIEFAKDRLATAFGAHAHQYLAPNLGATPGTEKRTVTALLSSYCKMDFSRLSNGCPLDIRVSATLGRTPEAASLLVSLLKVFIQKQGFYLQIDMVDPDVLRKAKQNPDAYPNLVVRISGWSARFASLSEEWQDMIINRTALQVQ